jgi:predicted ester cyclase
MIEEIDDLIAEGDKVVGRFTFRGTHTGTFLGIAPTGRKVSMTGIDVVRIRDGKITEFWYAEQLHDLLRQLGVLPDSIAA